MSQPLRFAAALALPLVVCLLPAQAAQPSLSEALARLAPHANPKVIALAVAATECAAVQGEPQANRLAVIDYSLPSTKPRLWVFDLAQRKLLYRELVAHGRNTGGNHATRFSNTPESHESSLGLFRTLGTYNGRNGYSLRMEGLEPGTNDNALARALVIHGAAYVSTDTAKQGRIGRSHGCPAVSNAVARPLIDSIKDGQYLFSYYPDSGWLKRSPYLKCSGGRAVAATLNAP